MPQKYRALLPLAFVAAAIAIMLVVKALVF